MYAETMFYHELLSIKYFYFLEKYLSLDEILQKLERYFSLVEIIQTLN